MAKKLTTLEARVASLAAARARVSAINDDLAAAKVTVDRLEAEVLGSMLDANVESVRTGTATVSVRRSSVPQVADWGALDNYIRKTGALDLLQRRVSVSAWRERLEAGKAVPGVDAFERVELAWRTAK